MKSFLLAHASSSSTDELLESCIQQLEEIPESAGFAFLYITDSLATQAAEILQKLKQATGIQNWVGSTGIGIIASQQEYYDVKAMVVMVSDFDEADFHILPTIKSSTAELTPETIEWCEAHEYHTGLIHADPENPSTQPLIHMLGEAIPGAFLFGGLSSSRSEAIQFANDCVQGGISGVLFSPEITILSNLTQGCTPIGPRHRITHCEQNIAMTLDNLPALDVLAEDAGEVMARDWEQAASYIFAGLINPHSDIEDYTIRQLMGVDMDNKLLAISDFLEQDQEIIFCRRDGNSALDDMQRMLLQLQSRIKVPIKGGVYISCLGRGREQFGINSEEVKLIHSVLGDFPLAGFFANGEIHKSMLYGFTGVLTLFV